MKASIRISNRDLLIDWLTCSKVFPVEMTRLKGTLRRRVRLLLFCLWDIRKQIGTLERQKCPSMMARAQSAATQTDVSLLARSGVPTDLHTWRFQRFSREWGRKDSTCGATRDVFSRHGDPQARPPQKRTRSYFFTSAFSLPDGQAGGRDTVTPCDAQAAAFPELVTDGIPQKDVRILPNPRRAARFRLSPQVSTLLRCRW